MDTTMTNWSSRPSGATTRGPEKTPSSEQLPDVPVAQRVFAVLAIVATLPYIVLKIMWLAGSRVGLNDPDFGTDLTMRVLNALTGALDVVALALAVTFLTRRGFRAPAILVLPPMWAGAGLLGTILVTLPVQLVIGAFSSPAAPTGAIPPIADWVFTMVYGGFTLLGIGLLGAFGVYAWQRWGRSPVPAPTRDGRTALALAAGLVVLAAVLQIVRSDRRPGELVGDGLIVLAAVAALLALVRPRGARADVVAVVVAFVTTGSLAAWGVYTAVILGVPNPLVADASTDGALVLTASLRARAGFAGVGAVAWRLRAGDRGGPTPT
jgi:hypothetical protein